MLQDLCLELPAKYPWVEEGPASTRTLGFDGTSETCLRMLKSGAKKELIPIFNSQICVLPTKYTGYDFSSLLLQLAVFAGSDIRGSRYVP